MIIVTHFQLINALAWIFHTIINENPDEKFCLSLWESAHMQTIRFLCVCNKFFKANFTNFKASTAVIYLLNFRYVDMFSRYMAGCLLACLVCWYYMIQLFRYSIVFHSTHQIRTFIDLRLKLTKLQLQFEYSVITALLVWWRQLCVCYIFWIGLCWH